MGTQDPLGGGMLRVVRERKGERERRETEEEEIFYCHICPKQCQNKEHVCLRVHPGGNDLDFVPPS